MMRAAVQALGLKLFAASSPAAALTAVASTAGVDSSDIVKAFRNRFGAVIANGQGEMKGQLFRIAHLGYYDYLDTIAAIGALEHVLTGLGQKVELGSCLRAAQIVNGESSKKQAASKWKSFSLKRFRPTPSNCSNRSQAVRSSRRNSSPAT